jgi:hypothetical protein
LPFCYLLKPGVLSTTAEMTAAFDAVFTKAESYLLVAVVRDHTRRAPRVRGRGDLAPGHARQLAQLGVAAGAIHGARLPASRMPSEKWRPNLITA